MNSVLSSIFLSAPRPETATRLPTTDKPIAFPQAKAVRNETGRDRNDADAAEACESYNNTTHSILAVRTVYQKIHDMMITLAMEPNEASIDLQHAALIIIDMQRDFIEPNGFGEQLGNDVTKLQRAIAPCQAVLEAARQAGLLIIHTREGHRPDLSDLHDMKRQRPGSTKPGIIGEPGPKGRILIRGEEGHDILPSLYPLVGEPIIDKPGKGSFYATDLECILQANRIQYLFVCGVTTEVCVHTTIREANDRGYYSIALSDCCASYFDDFHEAALKMIVAQGGIFGSVTTSKEFISALTEK